MLSLGLFILRVVAGLTVAAHGGQKIFGWWGGPGLDGWSGHVTAMGMKPARFWAIAAALAEFGGGLLVAFGFLNPVGSAAVIGSMLMAIIAVHLTKGFFNSNGGVEFPLLLGASVLTVALTGPGPWSLD